MYTEQQRKKIVKNALWQFIVAPLAGLGLYCLIMFGFLNGVNVGENMVKIFSLILLVLIIGAIGGIIKYFRIIHHISLDRVIEEAEKRKQDSNNN